MRKLVAFYLLGAILLSSCSDSPKVIDIQSGIEKTDIKYVIDPHSFSNDHQIALKNLQLNVVFNFEKKVLKGSASYELLHLQSVDSVVLDISQLKIDSIFLDQKRTSFTIGEEDSILGQALVVPTTENSEKIQIYYSTKPNAKALLWLEKEQTSSGKLPFVFTQVQPILSRSWFPCQDTPKNKLKYKAKITVPKGMLALMSAKNPQKVDSSGVYHFEMNQPIPTYLIALAAGELEYRKIGPRTGVYSEPAMLETSHQEFQSTEEILSIAESIAGPYQWGYYDLLVLPPGFPLGGMENPYLTFISPMFVTGKGDSKGLVAHELMHSWSGNLVTNATWNDFWLNEGITSYIQSRVTEVLKGKEQADMIWQLDRRGLFNAVERYTKEGVLGDTRLYLNLNDRDPDEGFSIISYDKGAMFMKRLEMTFGREKLDDFLKQYFKKFAFKTITTKEFEIYVIEKLIVPSEEKLNLTEWLFGVGMPHDTPNIPSKLLDAVEQKVMEYKAGESLEKVVSAEWGDRELRFFLKELPEKMSIDELTIIDSVFQLTEKSDWSLFNSWLKIAIPNSYSKVDERTEVFLKNFGRRTSLLKIYRMLIEAKGKENTKMIFQKYKSNYHYIARSSIEQMFTEKD